MTDISVTGGPQSIGSIQSSYMAQVQRRRLYGGLTLLIFVILMAAGFNVADNRNAGGFWDGLHQIGDYPAEVLAEAWEKRTDLPGLIGKYFPALIETINIAAVSTLFGAVGGLALSLLGTRGLAKWPCLVPLFRRISDIMRAVPEIVVALVLIFVLGGGKMFSEVAENADLKAVEGLASTGATWSQRMLLGVFPQVAPNYVSYSLLRFEINIRASAILGFVGAGGIGYELRNAMGWGAGRFDDAVAIFILLFGTIVFFDQISSRYRNRLTEGQGQ